MPVSTNTFAAFISSYAGAYSDYTVGIKVWHKLHGLEWAVKESKYKALLEGLAARLAPPLSKQNKCAPFTTDILKRFYHEPKWPTKHSNFCLPCLLILLHSLFRWIHGQCDFKIWPCWTHHSLRRITHTESWEPTWPSLLTPYHQDPKWSPWLQNCIRLPLPSQPGPTICPPLLAVPMECPTDWHKHFPRGCQPFMQDHMRSECILCFQGPQSRLLSKDKFVNILQTTCLRHPRHIYQVNGLCHLHGFPKQPT